MRTGFATAVLLGGLFLAAMPGCTTISKDECLQGDWRAIGLKDGAEGHAPSRLARHAETCANFGIAPDQQAYRAGWDEGIGIYCTPLNGFVTGRAGKAYHGLCPAALSGPFLEGRQLGQTLGDAERRVARLENGIAGAEAEIDRLRTEIDLVRDDDSLSREEKRDRLLDLRADLRAARDDLEEAEWALSGARIDLANLQAAARAFLADHGGTL